MARSLASGSSGSSRPPHARAACRLAACSLPAVAALWLGSAPSAQVETALVDAVNHPAILYAATTTRDAVARLDRRFRGREAALAVDGRTGYLRSLLDALDVPVESQLVVVSRTSLQASIIGPANPRLIYFNDQVSVAWPRGGFIELAAQDPEQGVIFYVLDNRPGAAPMFSRPAECLRCHVSHATLNVPGMLVRSVGTGADGQPMPWLANATPDHRTPYEERWGGWLVTGRTGAVRHLGNQLVRGTAAALTPQPSAVPSLDGRIDGSAYLTPHSDVAALLVFDHQMRMMNLLTRVGWSVRIAGTAGMAERQATIVHQVRELVDYMLFVGEPPLASPVEGSSTFAARFAATGPRDRHGRSLRELDLERRLFRYPCSYMIYSEAFQALPGDVRRAVYDRLREVLAGRDADPRYRHLSPADRRAVLEILEESVADW